MIDPVLEVEVKKTPSVVIVDCGYLHDKSARDRADRIFTYVARANLVWLPTEANRRIGVLIPPKKMDKVFHALPISDHKSWFGATHSFLAEGGR